ncbi:MAG: hypothetical protein JWN48_3343 [Myxococcaceae bacterium]|nr:hypothetical protein [Myxococcaceae bacterium]
MRAASQLLATAHPLSYTSNLGPVFLKPGATWSGERVLLYPAPMYIQYAVGDRIYEWSTSNFVRDEYLTAISRGAMRADGMVTLAKAEFQFFLGLFAPAYIVLGLTCAKVMMFHRAHRREFRLVSEHLPQVIAQIQALKARYPKLYDRILRQVGSAVFEHLPDGIGAEDVAFWLGRIIRGVAGAPELTIAAFARVVGMVTLLVSVTHAPMVTAHAGAAAAEGALGQVEQQLEAGGYHLSRAELKTILNDVATQPDAQAMLKQLQTSLSAVLPSLQQLARAYQRGV